MTRSRLISEISALLRKAAQLVDKSEQCFLLAGRRLCELKARHDEGDGTWAQWVELLRLKFDISPQRGSELMQGWTGERTLTEQRARKATSVALSRARKKAQQNQSSPLRSGEKPKLVVDNERGTPLAEQLDKENADAPFLAYVFRANDSWQLADQAASMFDAILEQTKPCADDWYSLVEMTRMAADKWTKLAVKMESMTPPVTRRTKRILDYKPKQRA
jgi:hypothetical protein